MDRRKFLKVLAVGGGAAALPALAASKAKSPPADAVGMLYDSTRCIGCKACVVACRESNGLPPSGKIHDEQRDLDATTKTVIKLWKDEKEPQEYAFVKQQCMHCVDPACVSACMLGALQKGAKGIVTYDKDSCIGCRYCQVACPFGVPKFEWSSATPRIVKCELCKDRLAVGKQPACTEVCPRQAVVFGRLADLKAEGRRRIAAQPSRYQQHLYGEDDLGGTQVLYLSAQPFVKLGLPDKGKRSGASVSETLQHGIYQGFITPAVLYVGLAAVVIRNRKKGNAEDES